jgi:hypothetical protein
MTPRTLRLALVPVLAFLATVSDRHYLADFWHHLARGRAIVEHGEMIDRDLFSCTVTGQPLQDLNWLTQVGYHLLFEAGGLALVQVVNSLLIAATLGWLVLVCQRRTGSERAAVLAGAVAFFGVWEVLTIRPQTLSMLLFVGVYDLLERSERRPWLLAAVPLLLALWANLHGAFPAGLILVGCFALAAAWGGLRSGRTRALAACLAACVLATLVNPYGWEVYRYVGGTSSVAYQRQIAEWVAPRPDRLIGVVWLASVVGLFGLLAWRWARIRQLPQLCDALLLGCFLAMSVGSVRMVAWWMLASAPVLAELLAWRFAALTAPEADAGRRSWLAGAVAALAALAVVFSLPGLADQNPLLGASRRGPRVEDDLAAVQRYVDATGRPGNVYTHFEWGEYLSWASGPRGRVFLDGRIEIYPDAVWDKYTDVTLARPGWEAVLDEYRVQFLILDIDLHGRSGLLEQVSRSPRWHRAFASGPAVLFVRAGS